MVTIGPKVSRMPVAFARCRVPAMYLSLVVLLAGIVLTAAGWWGAPTDALGRLGIVAGLALFVLSFVVTVASPRARVEPAVLTSPVLGEWMAAHSPASRVPSQGTHAWGQTYAIDLVYAPTGVDRPRFADGSGSFLGPGRFPGFGQPVLAPAAGIVVHVTDGAKDHRSRSSRRAIACMFLEGAAREIWGPRAVFGNHVVIRLSDGTHVLVAHLRRGSIRVAEGQSVEAGVVMAACGNSGHSTEPHVHMQRQDLASPYVALGLPWTLEGAPMPASGEFLARVSAR
ncbi:hypothetical protein GCM10025876_37880 [Demequina litorisediminis]|uniref:M23ase beta-sheet core domain-containing protein n=2 Tax=Demequina litorisediminis TaxID=1849022 RepID=A0ABQ6II74_9MICO|nr:hypothetical protein GCM10025876_37880 [Demequina litorisediminis]